METKLIKALLSRVIPRKNRMDILADANVSSGLIYATSTDEWILIDSGVDVSGRMDVALFKKTLSIEQSVSGDTCPDMPGLPEVLNEVLRFDISIEPFQEPLSKFVNYTCKVPVLCDRVNRRETLEGVYFDKTADCLAATDGYVLLKEKRAGIDAEFILPSFALGTIDLLPGKQEASLFTPLTDEEVGSNKRLVENGGEPDKSPTHLRIRGEGYTYWTKLIRGPYPQYPKAIPSLDSCTPVFLPRETAQQLLAGLGALTPYVNPKTHLVILEGRELVAFSRDTQRHVRIRFDYPIMPTTVKGWGTKIDDMTGKAEMVEIPLAMPRIGFDLLKLQMLLKEALTEPGDVTIQYSTHIGATAIYGLNKTLLVMPLRLLEPDKAEGENPYLYEPTYLDAPTAAPAPKPKAKKLDKRVEGLVMTLQEKYGPAELVKRLNNLELL